MSRTNWLTLAVLAAGVVLALALAASFLPLFVGEIWGPLWGVEGRPAEAVRSFGRVGPWCGLLPWAGLVAVPVAAALVLVFFSRVLVWFLWQRRRVGDS